MSPATAATLDVGYTLEGCRPGTFDQNTITCADGDYTTGNLGKSWSELDLVPFRVTLDNNSGSAKTGTFVVAGDYKNGAGTGTGWDAISVLTLNEENSDPGCPQVISGPQTITAPGAGVGGADQTIYRAITATIPAGSTCVYDYYMRLALGAHNFSGSSLQANLWNENLGSQGIGEKRVSIPVAAIAPQKLSKTMDVVKDAAFIWTLNKTASPVSADFANTCDPNAPRTLPVTITLSWTKSAANPTGYTITTVVTAENPAHRTIVVQATDKIYAGTTLLDTVVGNPEPVAANTSEAVLTHTFSITPAQLAALGVDPDNPNFNDVATATYIDELTGVPVPGTTSATASVANGDIGSGSVGGDTIVVTDSESITGAGLDFSVAAPSVGSFTGGYVADTFTTGPVDWSSGPQTSSGSVTFNKTVRVAGAADTTGTLSDTATGTFGSSTTTASASTTFTSDPLVALTINKRRSPVTDDAQTFNFVVKDASDATVASPSITIPGGTPATTDVSTTVTGLDPGTYTVNELASGPYSAQTATATIDLPSCSGSVSFNNVAAPATARVQKITVPGSNSVWQFTLTGPNGLSEPINATAGAGYVDFASALDVDGGTYTITETLLPGYDLTGVSGDFAGNSGRVTTSTQTRTCSFTLDQPADSGGVFSCTFTNTQQGTIIVRKVTDPVGAAGSFTFTGDAAGTIGDGGTITVSNLAPGTYTSTEADPTPGFDLTDITCDDSGSPTASSGSLGTRTATFQLDPGETVTCTFTNRQRGHAGVVKTVSGQAPTGAQAFTFQLRTGASTASAGTILETLTANAGNGGTINFTTNLVPGTTYQLCEQMMPGWTTSLGQPVFVVYNPSGDNSVVCTDFTVTAGQTKIFTIDNTPPPGGRALTIGFWKNWSSCSGSHGKQRPVLDQTLAGFPIAPGQTTHGVFIGDLYVDTCLEAVRILNKSTVNTGKKKASDPAFNLAAQLLAAKLNVQSGAGTCPAATEAITSGQALLDALNFNGVTHSTISKAQASQLNSLARTLDLYNNNLLC